MGRVALHLAGLRFNFILDWMFLADPADLRERLFETVYYFHAYPPGMNLLTGAILNLAGEGADSLARAVFCGFGAILVNSLFYLLQAVGLSSPVSLFVALAFALTPQSIFFEHLYLYTLPTAALLGLAAALFHRALSRPSFEVWFAFFSTCCAIGWIRSTFHLAWFFGMVALAVWAAQTSNRRLVIRAAGFPAALLLTLYLKNLALFGAFASASSSSGNLTHITISRMPRDLRADWIEEGKLSRFAALSGYASPRDMLPYFATSESLDWPELSALERATVGAPNFNHWFYLEANEKRVDDALYYVRQRPFEYVLSVVENVKNILGPSTTWHPHDRTERSPHREHRKAIGGFESLYNRLVHQTFLSPVGVYVLLPVVWLLAARRALGGTEGKLKRPVRGLVVFALLQILYVIALSALVNFGEASRYRYQIEAMIWLLTAFVIASWLKKGRGSRMRERQGSRQ